MSKHSYKAQETIHKTMREFSNGNLRSGENGKKVTDPKQALAIGIAKAYENNQKAAPKEES